MLESELQNDSRTYVYDKINVFLGHNRNQGLETCKNLCVLKLVLNHIFIKNWTFFGQILHPQCLSRTNHFSFIFWEFFGRTFGCWLPYCQIKRIFHITRTPTMTVQILLERACTKVPQISHPLNKFHNI
jgi:hypothetical protein